MAEVGHVSPFGPSLLEQAVPGSQPLSHSEYQRNLQSSHTTSMVSIRSDQRITVTFAEAYRSRCGKRNSIMVSTRTLARANIPNAVNN